jgi:hypothetical protein
MAAVMHGFVNFICVMARDKACGTIKRLFDDFLTTQSARRMQSILVNSVKRTPDVGLVL